MYLRALVPQNVVSPTWHAMAGAAGRNMFSSGARVVIVCLPPKHRSELMWTPQEILTVHISVSCCSSISKFSHRPQRFPAGQNPLIHDVRLQNGLLVELVARMLCCPWHLSLSSAAVATSSQPGSGSPWRDALSRCPDLLCWRLGTSVVQESWERGGKPQLLRADVPAAGWTTMDSAHTSRPSLQQSGA